MRFCEDTSEKTATGRQHSHKEISATMKKIMSLMLGLTLLTGAVNFAFGQDDKKEEKKKKKKKEDKKEVR